MKKLATLLVLLFPFATSLPATEPELPPTHPSQADFHLFLLAGQSNMAGRGKIDEEGKTPHPRVFVMTKEDAWRPATDPLHFDKPFAGAGIGKRFGEIIAESNPKLTIGLIPAAVGGTGLNKWQPKARDKTTNTHPYADAIQRAKKAMEQGTLKAILWHQGESDCREKTAPLYEEGLRELIQRFRDDLNLPNLPFFIGQLGQFPEKPWDEPREIVDAAQRQIAESMPNVYFIPSDGLTTGDGLHFDTESARRFAEAYAKAYQALPTQP